MKLPCRPPPHLMDGADVLGSGQLGEGRNLKDEKEPAKWTSGGRAFQAEGLACAKVLRHDLACHVGGIAERSLWLEQSEPWGE